jgi:hypothetical protein
VKITNLKCRDEGEKIKLTWSWHSEIELVYVNEKLFTLQEYKKRGGYFLKKTPGVCTYEVIPFTRENGEDILHEGDKITVSFKTKITCAIYEKIGLFGSRYINHEVTLTSEYDVPSNIICYTKSENGATYFFGELKAATPSTFVVRTEKNEYIRPFIHEDFAELYTL